MLEPGVVFFEEFDARRSRGGVAVVDFVEETFEAGDVFFCGVHWIVCFEGEANG